MKTKMIACGAVLVVLGLATGGVAAKGDMSNQKPQTVTVELSNAKGDMRFFPDKLDFEAGNLYKLVISNKSQAKHYFSSDRFAQSIYTRKVQVIGRGGKVSAEIKGAVREVEVYPGDTVEWWFVPIKAGMLEDLQCVIPGHAQAGMRGTIEIY